MKKRKILTIALISLLAISALTSCARQEGFSPNDEASDITEPLKTKAPGNGGTSNSEEIRKFVFNSAEDVEAISDEDLIYITQHYDSVMEQISKENEEIDLLGVPLAEKTVDRKTYREDVRTFVFECKLSPEKINVNEPFPDEILREYIDKFCKDLISSRNFGDGMSSTRTKNEEIICCGENDLYTEYSIRFTEVRSQYENGKYVTREIPNAYRYRFYKNELYVDLGDRLSPVYFGEPAMDKVNLSMETFLSKEFSGRAIYTEFSETEDAYICTSYHVHMSGGDYGLCDTATLESVIAVFDKNTHEIYGRYGEYFRRVDIPGTYHEPPDIW